MAATEDEIKAYPEYAELLEKYNYDWEPHEVKTEDGWYLTIFRIKPPAWLANDPDKLPLLCVHGSMDSAKGFILKSNEDSAWAL